MRIETERLILRTWTADDAESLFENARNPNVGPCCGWTPHKNIEESQKIIGSVLNAPECYAICRKSDNIAIGCIELRLHGHTNVTGKDDECELGYWIGEPFWGNGYVPEAAKALITRGFDRLGMSVIWCRYFDGNDKSRRVLEKLGFVRHLPGDTVEAPPFCKAGTGNVSVMTRVRWKELANT